MSNILPAVKADGRLDLIIIMIKLPTFLVGNVYQSMKYDVSPILTLFIVSELSSSVSNNSNNNF